MEKTDFLQINLSRLMGEKGWSQKRLADESGVSGHTVFRAVSKGVRPRGNNLFKLATALGVSEATLLSDPNGPKPTPAQTVGQMTPAELEALVARASKRDGTVNLENERLKKLTEYLPPEILSGQVPANPDWQIDFAWFFLTGNREYLRGFRKDLRENILSALRFYKMDPAARVARKLKQE